MGEYIREIRRWVGHRPVMQCGASVIVENERGEVLLEQRADTGDWAYIGGAVELYERTEDAAARELAEETGLIAEELSLLGVYSGEKMRFEYPNGDQVSNIDVVYVCRSYRGTLQPQETEVTCLRFFAPEALPLPFFPPNQPAMKAYLQARNISDPRFL